VSSGCGGGGRTRDKLRPAVAAVASRVGRKRLSLAVAVAATFVVAERAVG